MQGVSDDIIDAVREEKPLANPRLAALRRFTLEVTRQRGEVTKAQLDAFFNAGFDQRAVLDVVLGLSQKVMSNYVNHFADTPIDEPFAKYAWSPAPAHAAPE